MALRPIWWWFWLGWFPLFWFYPSYINAPIKKKKANRERTVSYYSGVGSVVSWVFFVVFLILFLSVAVDSTWYILYEIIWSVFLFFIIVFWCFGLGHYYYLDEFIEEQEILDKDSNDVSTVEGGEVIDDDQNTDLQPMRMRSSKQMKSLNMQL